MAILWTKTLDEYLSQYSDFSAGQIARLLGCNTVDICRRADKLGLTLKGSKPAWKDWEVGILKEVAARHGYADSVAEATGRTVSAVLRKAADMEIEIRRTPSKKKLNKALASCQKEAEEFGGSTSLKALTLPWSRISEAIK